MKITDTTVQSLPALRLQADGAEATILLHGAQVVGWRPAPRDGDQDPPERLYLSPLARFDGREAIRGGIPVIFPQFDRAGPDRQLPRHGFARTTAWVVAPVGTTGDAGDAAVLYLERGLRADGSDWPHRFHLEVRVRLGARTLDVGFAVRNEGETPFAFTAALHSYFAVQAIEMARLEGLDGSRFTDRGANALPGPQIETAEQFAFDGEVDRIHHGFGDAGMELRLTGGPSPLVIGQRGFDEVVVWNPGPARSATIDDLPDDGYRGFVCVEAARIAAPVALTPGQEWLGEQRLLAE
jgi:glucose-6-phosphate 1-epimerase